MPFVNDILKYKSLAIVGLEKNTGKTECLNYILTRLKNTNKKVALTSIGVDGENNDLVYKTAKPEIQLYPGIIFSTSERHYKSRKIISEIIDISNKHTALGRLVSAKAKSSGKVILSGPSDTTWLKSWIDNVIKHDCDLALVDGALSRFSPGSPGVTDAIILNTGANVSTSLSQLINQTKFTVDLINVEEFKHPKVQGLIDLPRGVYAIKDNGSIENLEIPSVLMIDKFKNNIFRCGSVIYASGIITDKILDFLRLQKNTKEIELIVKDFTKIFVSKNSYLSFINSGAKLKVLLKTKLISICVNPTSTTGYAFDTAKLCDEISKATNIPAYDVFQLRMGL